MPRLALNLALDAALWHFFWPYDDIFSEGSEASKSLKTCGILRLFQYRPLAII